jgi:hypothetical protein
MCLEAESISCAGGVENMINKINKEIDKYRIPKESPKAAFNVEPFLVHLFYHILY